MGFPRRIVVASQNPGKAREIARILSDCEVLSLAEFARVDFPEEGGDYAENARTKALVAARTTGEACIADDSGLEVEALGGRPGAHSARYGGPGLDDRGRFEKLLEELQAVPAPRRARFYCVAACAWPDGTSVVADGSCEGQILTAPRGEGGFGYDPIFQPTFSQPTVSQPTGLLPPGDDRSMAELTPSEKNSLSHRAKALAALAPLIEQHDASD